MTTGLKKFAETLAAAALLCSVAGNALADSELRQALAKVPAGMAVAKGGFAASFIGLRDLHALGLRTGDPAKGMGQRLSLGGADTVTAFAMNTDKTWENYTGIAPAGLSSFLFYGNPPATVVLWRFSERDGVRPFLKGLESRGFSSANGIWSNGEPMKFNIAKADYINPFLGRLGRASMLAPFDGGVVQSADPRAASAASGIAAKDSLAGLPPVAAALDGVESAAGGGYIPQAVVITPAVWLPGVDVADLLDGPSGDMKALADKMAAKAAQPGVPLTIGAIIADIETREPARRGVVIALPYADCQTAKQAGDLFADRWKNASDSAGMTGAARTGAEAVATTFQGKDACVATVSLLREPEDGPGNRVFRYVIDAIMKRNFKALQAG